MPKLAALAAVAFGIVSVGLVSVAGAQVPAVANRLPAPAPPAACQIANASLTSDALPKELTQKEPPPGVPYEVRTLKKSAPRALNIFEIGGTQRPGAKLVALNGLHSAH